MGALVRSLGRNDVRLFLTSATLLFVELALIRWVPANVTYIGFFTNFILMASFLGIGLGILAGRRWSDAGVTPFAILLFAIVALVVTARLNVQLRNSSELVFGIGVSSAADVNFLVLPLMFVLVTLTMATLDVVPLGPLLRSMPPLRAYAIDICGSLTGIAFFSALSAAATNPLLWFGVVAILVTLLSLGCGASTVQTGPRDPSWPATPPTQTLTCGAPLGTCPASATLRPCGREYRGARRGKGKGVEEGHRGV